MRARRAVARDSDSGSDQSAFAGSGNTPRGGFLRYGPCLRLPCLLSHQSSDLMWSDPDDIESWAVSPRGAGWLFGGGVTQEFNHVNSLRLIARAHQLVQEGYKYMFDDQLVTVWSAPNYCYRCGNMASILTIHENGEKTFKVYGAAEENERDKGMQTRRMVSRRNIIATSGLLMRVWRKNTMPYFV